jgi:hypothetical protein
MTDYITILGDILALLFTLWGTWLAGFLTAQIIKLLPLFLGLAGTLSFHQGFPMDAYRGLKTELKLAPLKFFTWPFEYLSMQVGEGDLIGFLGGIIAFPIVYFLFLLGVWTGLFYFSILRMLLRPIRFVYNLN